MTKERKCPSCSQWNKGDLSICEKCQSPLDSNVILKEEREKKFGKPKVEKPSWLEEYMLRTKDTTNPFVKMARFILMAGWITYMSILTFIIWFAVSFSG